MAKIYAVSVLLLKCHVVLLVLLEEEVVRVVIITVDAIVLKESKFFFFKCMLKCFFSTRYGPPVQTRYRLIVENLSTRCSWQVLLVLIISSK